MALATVLSCQSYISLMDRIEHAHHHAHFANPLAGDVQFCGGDHDWCGVSHDHAGDGADHQHSHGLPDHQHSGDAAIVFLAAQSFTFAISPVACPRCETEPRGLAGVSPSGLDRPPKSNLEIRA